jgi:hypothetical protein
MTARDPRRRSRAASPAPASAGVGTRSSGGRGGGKKPNEQTKAKAFLRRQLTAKGLVPEKKLKKAAGDEQISWATVYNIRSRRRWESNRNTTVENASGTGAFRERTHRERCPSPTRSLPTTIARFQKARDQRAGPRADSGNCFTRGVRRATIVAASPPFAVLC